MKTLALDLGTRTGVAWNYGEAPGAETLVLGTSTDVRKWGLSRLTRRLDPRVPRLYQWLRKVNKPDMVVFEDVQFVTYTQQIQLWSSLRAAVWCAFEGQNVLVECVPVTTLKKFATGSGSADKDQMRKALFTHFPQTRPGVDDNEVDAIWILKWAEKNLSRMTVL